MRRYWIFVAGIMAAMLLIFTVVDALAIGPLVDPSPWMGRADALAAGVGVSLLIVDVVLPVPSSLVMIANGSLFGLGPGAFLSLVGALGAGVLGYAIGRRGDATLGRMLSVDERARADRLLSRWGLVAIVVTRPIPILAETTVILAGASRVSWPRVLAALLIGTIPIVIVFAAIGVAANKAL